MFANARIYNRPDSQIIIDSNILESVAISTLNSITGNTVLHMPGPGIKRDKGAANDVIKR
jgi:hypothetical protein